MSDVFSYSKLDTYIKCPYKYKIVYVEGHKINVDTVATCFGTLVHYIEELIGTDLKNNKSIDYNYYKDLFVNIHKTIDKKDSNEKDNNEKVIIGVDEIRNKFPKDWYELNKQKLSYEDKARIYYTEGIYRLQNILEDNPEMIIYALELPFEVTIMGRKFSGYIDRVFYDKKLNRYIIEDIKTFSKTLQRNELAESLQMYVYTQALRHLVGDDAKILCYYNMPIIDKIQKCVIDMNIINKNLDSLFSGIDNKHFHPIQTPLCHWCVFSKTYPNQPNEAKNLCPYFSQWTRENKTKNVNSKWQGEERHMTILEKFIKKEKGQ